MEKKDKAFLALVICGIIVAGVFLSGCTSDGDENKKPSIDAGLDQTVNVGDIVQFTCTASDPDGSIVKYEWDFDGDDTYDWSSTTSGLTTHAYTNAGTYNAKFKVTDDDNAVVTDICVITVISPTNQPPTANAGDDQTVNVGDTVSFTGAGSDPDGSIVKYEWDFDGDGTYDWSSTVTGSTTHVYDIAGSFIAKLRVTDDDNATATDTCIITVNVLTITRAEIIDDNSYIDFGYLYVVGVVKNTGTTNLEFVKITGTFYDVSNNVVDTDFTFTMLDILKPNQISPFKMMLQEPSGYDHYSLQTTYLTTTEEPYSDLIIQGVTSHHGDFGYYYINGEVHNSGTKSVSFVKVVAIIYDASGKVIGTDFTFTDPYNLNSGQTAPFEFMIDEGSLPGTIDHYYLQVDCN